jgi:hypothetical protein
MVRRHNRLLVALYVVSDAILAMWAFVLAYGIRFESGLIPVYRGYPPLEQYLSLLPFVAGADAVRLLAARRLPAAPWPIACGRLLRRY